MTTVYYELRPSGDTDPANWTQVAASALPQAIGSLADGEWQARALAASDWSPAVAVTALTVPAQIGFVSVNWSTSASEYRLNITEPDNGGAAITDYEIRIDEGAGFGAAISLESAVPPWQRNITSLVSAGDLVQVRAVNSVGAGDWSASATVPVAPTGIAPTATEILQLGQGQSDAVADGSSWVLYNWPPVGAQVGDRIVAVIANTQASTSFSTWNFSAGDWGAVLSGLEQTHQKVDPTSGRAMSCTVMTGVITSLTAQKLRYTRNRSAAHQHLGALMRWEGNVTVNRTQSAIAFVWPDGNSVSVPAQTAAVNGALQILVAQADGSATQALDIPAGFDLLFDGALAHSEATTFKIASRSVDAGVLSTPNVTSTGNTAIYAGAVLLEGAA